MSSIKPNLLEPKSRLVCIIYVQNASIMDASTQILGNHRRFFNLNQEPYFKVDITFEIQ